MQSPNRSSATNTPRKRRISEVLEDINQDDDDDATCRDTSFLSNSIQSESSFDNAPDLQESTSNLSSLAHDQTNHSNASETIGENLNNSDIFNQNVKPILDDNSDTGSSCLSNSVQPESSFDNAPDLQESISNLSSLAQNQTNCSNASETTNLNISDIVDQNFMPILDDSCDDQRAFSPDSSYQMETTTDAHEEMEAADKCLKLAMLQQDDESNFDGAVNVIQEKKNVSPQTSPYKREEGKLKTTEINNLELNQLIDLKYNAIQTECEAFGFRETSVEMENTQHSDNSCLMERSIDESFQDDKWNWSTPVKQHPALSMDSDVSSISSEESPVNEVIFESDECLTDSDSVDSIDLSNFVKVNQSQDIEDIETFDVPEQAISPMGIYSNMNIFNGRQVTVNEGILTIMDLYIKNKLSKAAFERTVKALYVFLPENHNMPSSAHDILTYVESLAPPVPANMYYYCKVCLFYLGSGVGNCEICGVETEVGRFYCYDIAAIIKFFFESRNLASLMDGNNCNSSAALKSVRDGSVYKLINACRGKYDVTVIFGNDGVRIRKGSTKELWLAMFTVAGLPNHLQRSFMTIVGVWYDKKKPEMQTFLKPFAERMASLNQGPDSGVEWTHPTTGQVHKSCVRLVVTVLDAPARAINQNVSNFNGRYGCNICEIKTKRSQPVVGKKRLRVYYYVDKPLLRTKQRMLEQAGKAGEKPCRGVKGPSILSIIPSVDISKCIVPEYLHSVLLGVVKQLLNIWTTIPGEWSIKGRLLEIDDLLKSCSHPSFVHRRQRQLKSLKYWKASDFYYFLLFESLPILKDYLKEVYFQHYILLVKGIYALLKTSIAQADIDEAELLLKLFVSEFGKLYGSRQLTSNVHQLLHLPLCVRLYGPLYCFSAFPFEDLNGLIAKRTHGTNHVDTEIVNNIRICQGIHMVRNVVRGYCSLDGSSNAFCNGELLGAETKIRAMEDVELPGLSPKIFSRAKLGYDVYTSEIHKKLTTADFYVMWSENDNPKYGSIRFFAETSEDKFVVLRLFSVDHTKVFYHEETVKCIENVIPVKSSENFAVIKFSDIVSSITKVGKIGGFLYKRPNLYRYVM